MTSRTGVIVVIVVLILLAVLGGAFVLYRPGSAAPANTPPVAQAPAATQNASAHFYYKCDDDALVDIGTTGASQPPRQTLGSSITVSVNGGPVLNLTQTGSTGNLENYVDSSTGFLLAAIPARSSGAINGVEYRTSASAPGNKCMRVVQDPGNLPNIAEDTFRGYSVRYPEDYTVTYPQAQVNGQNTLGGVALSVGTSTLTQLGLASGTRIEVAADSGTGLSAGSALPAGEQCTAALFPMQSAGTPSSITTETINGVAYSVASASSTKGSDRYTEYVYALSDSNPCVAAHYFIHEKLPQSGESGMQSILATFDKITSTIVANI